MAWTLQQLVDEAYAELALAGYVFDLSPDEQQRGARRLMSMMATWEAKGVRTGFAFPANAADIDLDAPSGLSESAAETVYLNLAVRLSAGLGKQLSPSTMAAAREGYEALLLACAMPPQQQLPNTMPRGAGNKPWGNLNRPFMPTPDTSPLQVADDGGLRLGD
jgi:hypothetical protein